MNSNIMKKLFVADVDNGNTEHNEPELNRLRAYLCYYYHRTRHMIHNTHNKLLQEFGTSGNLMYWTMSIILLQNMAEFESDAG